jgi:hypothetical protein
VTIFGHSPSLAILRTQILPRVTSSSFPWIKYQQNHQIVRDITTLVETKTSSKRFNAYVENNFIDNVLRGGLPVNLAQGLPSLSHEQELASQSLNIDTVFLTEYHPLPLTETNISSSSEHIPPKIFHTYSRIHGDLERDYNSFQLEPTAFSQGPGNFRDVAQNRRTDVMQVSTTHSTSLLTLSFFKWPEMRDSNVITFMSFVQADGFNPLTVNGDSFQALADPSDAPRPSRLEHTALKIFSLAHPIADLSPKFIVPKIVTLLTSPWRPGQLFNDFKKLKLHFDKTSRATVLILAVQISSPVYLVSIHLIHIPPRSPLPLTL